MMRCSVVALAVLGLVMTTVSSEAQSPRRQGAPVDLLDAMATGRVEAVFYGNGDESVRGRIRRSAFGPQEVTVSPGTQFWAQQDGLQGMTTLGWVPIDLTRTAIAYVEIPTACTNYDLPAPTRFDRMDPVCCPDRRMAVVSEYVGKTQPPRPVAQLAVWAVANNPEWSEVVGWAESRALADDEQERAEQVASYRQGAANLLLTAGFDPAGFRMFRE
ncbi:MAG: hypothetical protein GX131_13470 [candidate division WS1 bacterium]|nr:hypothetical protein [candidate division WS1 bacterium]